MALFESFIFGSVRKKMGNIVMYKSRGQNIVKMHNEEVKNPRTESQCRNRECFSSLAVLSGCFQEHLLTGFPKGYKTLAMNAFMHENKGVVSINADGELVIDHRRLVFSVGELTPPDVQVAVDTDTRTVTFTSAPQPVNCNALRDDKIYIVLWEKELQYSICIPWKTRRDPLPLVQTLPAKWQPQNLYLYTYAVTASRRRTSATVLLYDGTTKDGEILHIDDGQ